MYTSVSSPNSVQSFPTSSSSEFSRFLVNMPNKEKEKPKLATHGTEMQLLLYIFFRMRALALRLGVEVGVYML